MTRRRSSPLGLELVLSVVLTLVVLPLLSHGAPVQESHADLQRYSEGCYYNYNHYSEGDRILTNEPCLNCTCHNRMLMCYLRVCPFTKPIGHDCTVEKREDQCCPIVTCPEVPVDVKHHSNQLTTSAPGTELSIPEKYGCSIDSKFYAEGAQVPANPNKPCELCYCIRNRTSCLMQECTLHIDGCQPIYNKGSCCPVRYNCDHENELLEIEDFSTTTTTVRPTQGYLLPSTTSPSITTDCFHNNEVYADGASITGKSSCEHCYCMRGDIVCAVQECEMPTLESGAKTCHALPPAVGECCPSNYVCDDDSVTTEGTLTEDDMLTTIPPMIQDNLHDSVSQEDVQLQEHIDDKIAATEVPDKSAEHSVEEDHKFGINPTTILPIAGEVAQPSEEEVKESEEEKEDEEKEKPLLTTVSAIEETNYETTQAPIEHSTTYKTEEGVKIIDQNKENEFTQAPIEDEIINEDKNEVDIEKSTTTVSSVVGDIQTVEDEEVLPSKIPVSSPVDETTIHSIVTDEEHKGEEDAPTTTEEKLKPGKVESTSALPDEKDEASTASTVEISKPDSDTETVSSTTLSSLEESDNEDKLSATEVSPSVDIATETITSVPSKTHIEPVTSVIQEETSSESVESSDETSAVPEEIQDKIDANVSEPTSNIASSSPAYEMITEGDDSHISMPEIGDHKTEAQLPKKKPKDEQESVEDMPIPIDDTKVILDTTTGHAVDEEEVTATQKPLTDSDEIIPQFEKETPNQESESEEFSTSKPSITLDESEETTQDTVEDVQKPVQENDEVPAVVQEVTEIPIKQVSGDIPQEEDIILQTTSIPPKDMNVDEVSESQEKGDEVQSTESSDITKRTTTGRPIRIHIEDEDESTEIPSEGVEEEISDSSTSVPSLDSNAAITEKSEEGEVDSQKPSSEEEEIKPEQEVTTTAPTMAESGVSSAEEEDIKQQKETEILSGEPSTPTPLKTSEEKEETDKNVIDHSTPSILYTEEPEKESEQGISESTTIIPSISESETPESEEDKEKPDSGDLSTASPSVDESVESHKEGEQEKIQPVPVGEVQTTSTPDSEVGVAEEEEHKKLFEQNLIDSSTKQPSLFEDEETTTKNHEVMGKPLYDSTEIPSLIDSGAANAEEDIVKQEPDMVMVDSTTIPSESKPAEPTSEEEFKPKPDDGIIDLTTILPAFADSDILSLEEDNHKKKLDHEISDATTVTPSVSSSESPLSEAELEVEPEHHITVVPGVDESENTVSDPTTVVNSISEKEKPSVSEPEAPALEEGIEQESELGTTVSPIAGSVEEMDEKQEEIMGVSTTAGPKSDFEAPIGEEKEDQEMSEASTKTPVATKFEASTTGYEQTMELQTTTIIPSLIDSESSTSEKEKVKEQPELHIAESSTTTASSLADAGTSSQPTHAPASEQEEEHYVPTTSIPHTIEPEQTSTKADQDKQPIDNDDILRTTLSPITQQDKKTAESPDISEGSGVPVHDIIPSAIPGEGDCLENGKTYANNATIPTSSECDLSCTCVSSIVVCQRVQCYEPPQPNDCVLDIASTDKCCPQYICGIDSFAEDQRPTTPEDIEDEEIQFTTLAHISTDSGSSTIKPEKDLTVIHDEEPLDKDESAKTETPAFSDKITTPSSIDIELPAVTPDQPMSHIKDDEAQEESTEHSEENISVEVSTTTKQPITTKPTKQVTGDIEQPLEFTSISETTPSKKTEESITTASDKEEQQTTPASVNEEISPSSIADIESGKPVTLGEEISTKSPIITGAPEISEPITATEGTLEKEPSTLKPVKTDSEPPLVIDTDDSEQSEETTETSDENSNESGEETESEEDIKSPVTVKEEKTTTTAKPIISEHAGDIEPVDDSTIIPEIDYHTPGMPDDLSHTKVDEDQEKPFKPTKTGDSQESEEVTEMTHTTSPSTILTLVKPADKDSHNVDTPVGISDKNDDIPSSETEEEKPSDESTEHEEKPISFTVKPTKVEDETVTESKKEQIASQTSSPVPTAGQESDFNEDEIASQTSAPVSNKVQPIAGTIAPATDYDSNEDTDDKKPTTSATVVEGSGAGISEEESEDSTSASDANQTISPVSSDESTEEKVDVPSQTSVPALEEHSIEGEDGLQIKKDETASQTSAPAIGEHPVEGSGAPTSEEKHEIEENDITSQTSSPSTDKQAIAPVQDDEDKIDVTFSPVFEENSVEGSGAPVPEEKPEVEKNKIFSQTSAPAIDKQTTASVLDEEANVEVTISPVIEEESVEGSGAPISEVEEHEISSQTSAPAIDKQTHAPVLDEEDKVDVTISPVVEEHSVEGSGAAISANEIEDKIMAETTTPAIEKQPTASDLEQTKFDVTMAPMVDEDSMEGSGVPISGEKDDDDKQEDKTEIKTPINEEITLAPVSGPDSDSIISFAPSTLAPVSGTESEEDISSHTIAPSDNIEPKPSTPASGEDSDEENTDIEGQTAASTHGLDDKISPQGPISHTTELSLEKEPHDSTESSEEGEDVVSETVAPSAGDKYENTELSKDKNTSILVPISDEEQEVDITTVPTAVKDDKLKVPQAPLEDVPTKDAETSNESIDSTEAPSKDISAGESSDESVGATESSATSSPTKTIEEEEEAVTSSPATPIKVDFEIDNLDSTQLPSSTAKPMDSVDELLEVTQSPQDDFGKETQTPSSVTMSSPKFDEEISVQTEGELSTDLPHTNETHIDKTLITTEIPLPSEHTLSPSSEIEEPDREKQSNKTEKPALVDRESSTETYEESEGTDATVMPEIISSHETPIIKPESDDQILIEDAVTAKPSVEEAPALNESTVPAKEPHLEEAQTTTQTLVDKLEADKEPLEPVSVDVESAEDLDSKTHRPVAATESPVSISFEDEGEPEKNKPVTQTESPSSASSEEDISSEAEPSDTSSSQTDKPFSQEQTKKPASADEDMIEIITKKPAYNTGSEEGAITVSSTLAPVEEQPITPSAGDIDSEHTTIAEKLNEEEEHTEKSKDDTKVQTIAEFVTERVEDFTSVAPVKDTEKEVISEELDSNEITTSSSEEEEKEKPEVSITTEKVITITSDEGSEEKTQAPEIRPEISEEDPKLPLQPTSVIEESEEKTQAPEIQPEIAEVDHKPQVQPTSSIEESEEKTEAPEISSQVIQQDHNQQVQPSSSTEKTEEKTQAPETSSEVTGKPHKQQVQPESSTEESEEKTQAPEIVSQPTEGSFPSSTSDKPIESSIEDKINADLPKPLVTGEPSISEEEPAQSTTIHPLFPHIEHNRTTSRPTLNATDKIDDEIPESVAHPVDALPSSSVPTTEQPTTSQSITNAPSSQYQPPGYGQGPPPYPTYPEDEYTDEDETEVFGPGTCRYGGKLFVSAQQIPRDDPCDFCFCFRSDIICLQQSCPPPISGCHEEPISGFCCPRYECPVSMATTLNITTSTTTTSTTLPPHFLHHAYRGAAAKNGCHISGKSYKVGDKIDSASGPCMHCTCGGDGQMKCDPKTCSPEPMLRQMIAVVASRRR